MYTETTRTMRERSPGHPPRFSHSFWTLMTLISSSSDVCLTFTETIRSVKDREPRMATSTLTQLLSSEIFVQVQCCFKSTETIRAIMDGEPRTATATSTFAQLLTSDGTHHNAVYLLFPSRLKQLPVPNNPMVSVDVKHHVYLLKQVIYQYNLNCCLKTKELRNRTPPSLLFFRVLKIRVREPESLVRRPDNKGFENPFERQWTLFNPLLCASRCPGFHKRLWLHTY